MRAVPGPGGNYSLGSRLETTSLLDYRRRLLQDGGGAAGYGRYNRYAAVKRRPGGGAPHNANKPSVWIFVCPLPGCRTVSRGHASEGWKFFPIEWV